METLASNAVRSSRNTMLFQCNIPTDGSILTIVIDLLDQPMTSSFGIASSCAWHACPIHETTCRLDGDLKREKHATDKGLLAQAVMCIRKIKIKRVVSLGRVDSG